MYVDDIRLTTSCVGENNRHHMVVKGIESCSATRPTKIVSCRNLKSEAQPKRGGMSFYICRNSGYFFEKVK